MEEDLQKLTIQQLKQRLVQEGHNLTPGDQAQHKKFYVNLLANLLEEKRTGVPQEKQLTTPVQKRKRKGVESSTKKSAKKQRKDQDMEVETPINQSQVPNNAEQTTTLQDKPLSFDKVMHVEEPEPVSAPVEPTSTQASSIESNTLSHPTGQLVVVSKQTPPPAVPVPSIYPSIEHSSANRQIPVQQTNNAVQNASTPQVAPPKATIPTSTHNAPARDHIPFHISPAIVTRAISQSKQQEYSRISPAPTVTLQSPPQQTFYSRSTPSTLVEEEEEEMEVETEGSNWSLGVVSILFWTFLVLGLAVYLYRDKIYDPRAPIRKPYCNYDNSGPPIQHENCEPCPANGFCGEGILQGCMLSFTVVADRCVLDKGLAEDVEEVIAHYQSTLSTIAGRIECGENITNGISMAEIEDFIKEKYPKNSEQLIDLIAIKITEQRYNLEMKIQNDKEKIVISTRPVLPFLCDISQRIKSNYQAVSIVIAILTVALIANFWKSKKHFSKSCMDELTAYFVEKLREKPNFFIPVANLRSDALEEFREDPIATDYLTNYWTQVMTNVHDSSARIKQLANDRREMCWLYQCEQEEQAITRSTLPLDSPILYPTPPQKLPTPLLYTRVSQ